MKASVTLSGVSLSLQGGLAWPAPVVEESDRALSEDFCLLEVTSPIRNTDRTYYFLSEEIMNAYFKSYSMDQILFCVSAC